MDRKAVAIVFALAFGAGCATEPETLAEDEEETLPEATSNEPPLPPEREPERSPCAPLYKVGHDGFVIKVPVECIPEGIDRGDPPTENPANEIEIYENPADQHV
jgi:hypothetical protein